MKLAQYILNSFDEPTCVLSSSFQLTLANKAFLDLLSFNDTLECNLGVVWPTVEADCSSGGRFSSSWYRYSGDVIAIRGTAVKYADVVVVRIEASAESGATVRDHHRQRIETLGVLAGGIAHDFNNVLTGVLGHVAYLKHKVEPYGDAQESLLAIEDGALRGSELVKQILSFSRLDSTESPRPVDVRGTCRGVVTLLKSAIPSRIAVSLRTADFAHSVVATEAQINQILINLIINARDAIEGEGSIEVGIDGVVSVDDVTGADSGELAVGRYLCLQVVDSGTGMSSETRKRIFEPYFSTKQRSGTGLGLSTVCEIVRELGGAIEVRSKEGAGSTFRIYLPLYESEGNDTGASIGIPNLKRGSGQHILVIDDEDAVRNVLSLSLKHLGYTVDVAGSGADGIAKIEACDGGYDLIMLDVLMPEMSGDQVFYTLREDEISTPVLLMSGFSSEHIVERMIQDGAAGFIRKPFSIEPLSQRVREIVGG